MVISWTRVLRKNKSFGKKMLEVSNGEKIELTSAGRVELGVLPNSPVSDGAWEKYAYEIRLIRAYPMPRDVEPQLCRGKQVCR